jgi:hypothetical protein
MESCSGPSRRESLGRRGISKHDLQNRRRCSFVVACRLEASSDRRFRDLFRDPAYRRSGSSNRCGPAPLQCGVTGRTSDDFRRLAFAISVIRSAGFVFATLRPRGVRWICDVGGLIFSRQGCSSSRVK